MPNAQGSDSIHSDSCAHYACAEEHSWKPVQEMSVKDVSYLDAKSNSQTIFRL